jgi:hypothetical protein
MYTPDHERYRFAEQLYCFTDKSISEIAKLAEIPERSVYRRARDYKWETLRRASKRSPLILSEEMYRELADLTASINQRPEGQRIPTPQEADLRRKILNSIAAIKKFPTHAEVTFILQSLLRYNDNFYGNGWEHLGGLIDSFLSHRDIYGFSSYQPEHNQDLGKITDEELDLLLAGPQDGEDPSPYNDPDHKDGAPAPEDIYSESYLNFLKEHEERMANQKMQFKFGKTPNSPSGGHLSQ